MISLDQIIRDACEEDGDLQYKKYMTYQRFVIRGISDLTKGVIPDFISVPLEVKNNLTVDLPEDLVFPHKVGIISCGKIVVLGVDNNISLTFNDPCRCETFEEANAAIDNCFACGTSGSIAFSNLTYGGQFYNEWYGIGGGYNYLGYYRHDKQNQRLVMCSYFDRIKYPEIIVEYKASGIAGALTNVPEELRECLIAFARSKANAMTNPNISVAMWEHYMNEYSRLKRLYGASFGIKNWHALLLQGVKSSVKR